MNENILTTLIEKTTFSVSDRALKTIGLGGLTVGMLDCFAANLNAMLAGLNPIAVWKYVASGILGKSSYEYTWESIVFGLVIHFVIAFVVTTIYYLASFRLPELIQYPLIFGLLYGIAVYFVMGYVITPLSAAAKLPTSYTSIMIGILIHIICVGLPISFIVKRFSKDI